MIGPRLFRLCVQTLPVLTVYSVCLAGPGLGSAMQQSTQNSQPPQQQPAPPAQKQPPQKQNPFENVPEAPNQPQPKAQENKSNAGVIEDIEFRGQRRIPQDTLRALILSRKGDVYTDDAVHRDFLALWNSGRFDD